MKLKKFQGKSIADARNKAKEHLGQNYIVVETKDAGYDEPAWIHVLDEEKSNSTSNNEDIYSRRDLFPKALAKLKETVNDGLQLFNLDGLEQNGEAAPHALPPGLEQSPVEDYLALGANGKSKPASSFSLDMAKEPDYKEEFKAISQRFDRLEELVAKQMISGNVHYVSHPAYQQLLSNGIPPAMINGWFNELLGEGLDPYSPESNFTPLLANKIQQTLDVAASVRPAEVMVFSGAAGAGKSSLIMKLALDDMLLGDAKCALVSVVPDTTGYYFSPLSDFASKYELPHIVLNNNKQLDTLKKSSKNVDHFLVEMPGKRRQMAGGKIEISDLKELTKDGKSIEVHTVVNAALNEQCLQAEQSFYQGSEKHYLDFTHMDVTPHKGHLLPLMQRPGCQVRYIVSGTNIPGSITKFEPAGFAKQLLFK